METLEFLPRYAALLPLSRPYKMTKKLSIYKDKIIEMFLLGISCKEIGTIFSAHRVTVSRLLKDNNIIYTDKADETYRDKEWLIEQYVSRHRSGYDIAVECGVNYQTIYNYIHKYNINIMHNGHCDIKDISNMRFGRLVAICPEDKRTKSQGAIWKCECDCGIFVSVSSHALCSNHTRSCGCLNDEKRKENFLLGPESNFIDISGQRFGRWVVVERAYNKGRLGAFWRCKCDCGCFGVVKGGALRSGDSMSCGCLQREAASRMCGEKNPNWNPDLTDEERKNGRCYPEYTEWRNNVLERDNYTCQKCGGSSGVHLNVHHIESYNVNKELRTTLENGVTLCADRCHKGFHHQYGKGNNTRDQFNKFMQEGS